MEKYIVLLWIVGGVVFILVFLRLIRWMGDNDIVFSNLIENRTKFVMRGDRLVDAFTSTKGKALNGDWRLVPALEGYEGTTAKGAWCPLHGLGVCGPLLPFVEKIHRYDFVWNSPVKEADEAAKIRNREAIAAEEAKKRAGGSGHVLRYKIRYHRSEEVDSLFSSYVYPLLLEGIELTDGTKIDMIIWVKATARNVQKPVFEFNGDWFVQMEAAVTAVVTEWCKIYSYSGFESAKKDNPQPAHGEEKALIQSVQDFLIGYSLIIGIDFTDVKFAEYDLSYDPGGLIEAAQQKARVAEEDNKKKIADALANATVTITDGEAKAKAITATGNAEADVLRKKYEATGSDPDVERIKSLPANLQVLGGDALISIQQRNTPP